MLKLMKYEFRKTMFSKLILLVITALVEVLFLAGVFLEWEKGLYTGIFGLVMCALVGIIYIGIESLLVFSRDLNTKKSYMLFLTPKNNFQVLGAKVLENGFSIFLAGAFFAVLAVLDISTAVIYIGGMQQFLDMLEQLAVFVNVDNITASQALAMFFACLSAWLMMVVTGYLAIVLSATVFAGKKFSGFVSFVLYLLLNWGATWLIGLIPEMDGGLLRVWCAVAGIFGISGVMYVVTGWIMNRKLSV